MKNNFHILFSLFIRPQGNRKKKKKTTKIICNCYSSLIRFYNYDWIILCNYIPKKKLIILFVVCARLREFVKHSIEKKNRGKVEEIFRIENRFKWFCTFNSIEKLSLDKNVLFFSYFCLEQWSLALEKLFFFFFSFPSYSHQ